MFAILSLLLFTVILINGDVVTDVSNHSNDHLIDYSNGYQIDGLNDYQIDDSNGYQIDGSNDYQIDDSNGYQIDGSNDYHIEGSIHDQLIETYSTQEMEGIKVNISSLWSEVNEIKAWTQKHDANIYKNSKRKGYQAYNQNRNKYGNRQRGKGPHYKGKYYQKKPTKNSGKRWNKQNGDRQSSDDEPIDDEVATEISNLAQIQTTDMRQQKKHEDSSDEDSVETSHSKNSQRPQKNDDSSEENSTEIGHSKNSQRQQKIKDSSEENSTEKKRSTEDHGQQNNSDSSDENTEKNGKEILKFRANLSTKKLANYRGNNHIRRKHRRSKSNRRPSRRTQKLDENELISKAFCDLEPNIEMSESNVTGTIVILQKRNGKGPLHFHVNIQGFQIGEDERSRTHGFHIHANPLSEGGHCNSTGPHFNPLGLTHGSLYTAKRHLGDFGNIVINKEGKLVQHLLMDYTNTLTGQNSIISKSMDVHEFPDDLGEGGNEGSLKNGNAGRKLACCTVHSVAVGSPLAITQN